MDQLTRNFLDNLARLVRDDETENTSEIVETVVAASQPVAVDITEPFSLNALIDFSEINGNPKGFERLSESGYVDIHWAKRESKTMSNDDLQCLKAYYERQYAVPITVQNHVEKFKEIKVLGYVYKSKLHGDKTAAAFNAYRCNDVETDDLEGVKWITTRSILEQVQSNTFSDTRLNLFQIMERMKNWIITLLLLSGSKILAKARKHTTCSLMISCDLLEMKKKRKDRIRLCLFKSSTRLFIYKEHLLRISLSQPTFQDALYNKKNDLYCQKKITFVQLLNTKKASTQIRWD